MHEMQELQVQSLGWEDPLEKEMATHSSILDFNFYGQRTLAGYRQWDCKRVRHDWTQEHTEFQEAVVSPEMVVCWVQSKVQFSRSVVSISLQPHGLQHTRLPCPSPTPRAYSNSCLSSQWCHPTISSCHPLLLPPSIFASIRVFSNESALHIRWPKYWLFSFSISPSSEYSGMISFRMDWLDLLAVQGTLKSLLQHQCSKASILWHSAFFIVQLSHPYMTTGKTIALTRQTFAGKVMSLFFNMLSRLLITFLPRSKSLLILWLQSQSAVILENHPPKKWCLSLFLLFPHPRTSFQSLRGWPRVT